MFNKTQLGPKDILGKFFSGAKLVFIFKQNSGKSALKTTAHDSMVTKPHKPVVQNFLKYRTALIPRCEVDVTSLPIDSGRCRQDTQNL